MWWDTALTTAEPFNKEIRQALSDSRCVVVLWSPRSATSDWVISEAELARERGILVPVLIEECQLPLPFGTLHSANLMDWKGSETATEWGDVLNAAQAAFTRGPEVTQKEADERQRRIRAYEQRRTRNRIGMATTALAALAIVWLLSSYTTARGAANRLADVANEIRLEVLTSDTDTVWWWRLFDSRATLDKVEASLLVAIEAARTSPTKKALDALGDSFALLPWSDGGSEIAPTYSARTLTFDETGTYAISAGALGDTLVWSIASSEIVARLPHGHTGGEEWVRNRGWGLSAGSQMADIHGELIATAGPDNLVHVWKTDGSAVRTMEHSGTTIIVQFSPQGDVIAAADESGELRLWATSTGELLHTWAHDNTRDDIKFSESGRTLAALETSGAAIVWDTASGRQLMRLDETDTAGLEFVPGERSVLVYGAGASIRDIDNGKLLRRIGDDNEVYSAIFGESGRVLVLATNSGLEWWNPETGQRLFGRDADPQFNLAADNSGTRLISFDVGEVQAWDFRTGRLLRRIPFARELHSAAIDPRGEWLAVIGADWNSGRDVIEFAQIQPDSLRSRACDYVSRNLTATEWDEYMGNVPYRKTCAEIEQ